MNASFARQFAQEWIAAWNAHDLDAVLSHYTEDFEMASPVLRQMMGEPSGTLKGKSAVAAYWRKALDLLPDLHFELENILLGANSLTLYYLGHRGPSAEVFFFNEAHKVYKAAAHYALPAQD